LADDNKILLELDLDTGKFTQKIKGVDDQLGDLGKKGSKSVGGLQTSVDDLVKVVGASIAVFKSLQFVMESIFNAEEVAKVTKQFDTLSASAGVAGNKLKDALVAAAGGKIDDSDLLVSANKALASLGKEAERLPEVLALAQKTTALYGGDLKENFENLVQAASTGNTRLLKQQGIVLDSDKAIKDYSKSIGVTADSLSAAGRAQALMSGILDQGGKKYKDVSAETDTATVAFAKLKVALGQLKETFDIITNSSLGGTVKGWLNDATEVATDFTNFLKRTTGSGREQASLELDKIRDDLMQAKAGLIDLEQEERKYGADSGFPGGIQKRREILEAQVKQLEALLPAQEAYSKSLDNEAAAQDKLNASKAGAGTETAVDPAKRAEQEKEFYRSLDALRQQNTQLELQAAQQEGDFDRAQMLEKQRLAEAYALQVQDIQLKEQQGQITKVQANELVLQSETNLRMQLDAADQGLYEKRKAALDAWVGDSQTAADGMSRAFKQGAAQASADMNNFGMQGQRVFSSFTNHSKSALIAFGAGTKSASEAAKGFIFNMLADEAEARGQMLMLSSLFPPNPLGIAAGAGLIALSGFIRSQAGGGASGGAGVSSGGGGGAVSGGISAQSSNEAVQQNEAPKKSVTVAIQGNYFETDQSRTRLMEMIRESGDFTDFNLKQVGQS
jgi:hypothetical protein